MEGTSDVEWTTLHGALLARAFERVLGRAEEGAVAFVRCLTPAVVEALATDGEFAPADWHVLRVADRDDAGARTITADGAVERRETKGDPTLLLVDTDRAGAGMDGIYSASREIDEADLFDEALRLAGAEVTRRSSSSRRRDAERALKTAAGFGRRYSIPPWTEFDFLCRLAYHDQHPGACLHRIGLWPIAESGQANFERELDLSRRFVDHLLGGAGLTIPARIESLRLAEPTDEQRRDLERFLHAAEARPLLPALAELADKKRLWIGEVRIEVAQAIQTVELTSWRNPAGRILKWSGLVQEADAPVLILKPPESEDVGDYSKLTIRWKARPGNLEKHAVDYRVAVLTGLDEELAARDVRHSARREETCRFSDEDFTSLDESSHVSAKVVVSVIGNQVVEPQESEEFIIRFGEPPDKTAGGVGKKVRTFSEGLVEFQDRDRVSAIAASPIGTAVDAKGFVPLRVAEGRSRRSFRVFRPRLIHDVERQWTERAGAIGRWRIKVRASGERVGVPEFIPFEGQEVAAGSRAGTASRRMADRFKAGGGVAQVYDDGSKAFDVVREYVLAWTALLDGDPLWSLCNTVEVQSLSGQTIGLIVLPAHPSRAAWHAAYDNLVLHAAFDQKQAAANVRKEFGVLDGAMFPAFLPDPGGGAFVFADTLGFHAVGMVPDRDPEPKAALAVLARALGESESEDATPTVGAQSAAVIGDEVVRYLECHDASRLLQVHALRAGDGLTIARALGRVHHGYRGADGEETAMGSEEHGEVDGAGAELAFSLELYPSPRQRGIAGRFIAAAREKRRSGAGVLSTADRWMLESLSLPGGVTMPRLRWARRWEPDPATAAHLAVAFDTFESRVTSEASGAPAPRPFHAFGLLAFYERAYVPAPNPVWRSLVPLAEEGEKHPSERGHTERLTRLGRAIRQAVARHLGFDDGFPVLRTEVSPEKADSLERLHRLCDWVVTLDRNAGIEYFDSPRDGKAIYDTYVIDCVPEREDLGGLRLITSTGNLDDVRASLERSLDRMGLDRGLLTAEFVLDQLKSISGRLAIRLSGDTGADAPTPDLIGLSVAYANCRRAGTDDGCWVPLDGGFVIPVDDVRDLLPFLSDAGEGKRDSYPDLIHVSLAPRKGLAFRFITVKARRHLREARAPEMLRSIEREAEGFRTGWREWFAHDEVCSSFRAVRRARLARLLIFYADKARRHHLSASSHEKIVSEINRMIERGGDYVFHEPPVGDHGWIFCPEYAGREPMEIAVAGSGTRIFLFGPGLSQDGDARHPAVANPDGSGGETRVQVATDDSRADVTVSDFDDDAVRSPSGSSERQESGTPIDARTDVLKDATAPEPRGDSAARSSRVADTPPSICLGTDLHANAGVHWSLTVKGNPHLLIAGLPGMGKTTCLLSLCRQMVAAGVRPIVFSYHQDIDERLGGLIDAVRFIDFDGLGFNPLRVMQRESATAHLDVAGSLRDVFSAIFPDLGDLQCERVRSAIKESFVEAGWPAADVPEPEFRRFVEILRSDPKPDRGLRTLLARLGELEDYGFFEVGETRESLWESDRPVVIRIHATQNDTLQRAFAALVFYGLYKDMFRRGIQDRITHALIFDEAHRAAGLKLIPTMAKECRKYGISLVLASQEARDFHVSLFSAIANYLVLRLTEADAKALVRNVATAQQERALIDRLKQMDRFKALYFCEGKRRPAPVGLPSLD